MRAPETYEKVKKKKKTTTELNIMICHTSAVGRWLDVLPGTNVFKFCCSLRAACTSVRIKLLLNKWYLLLMPT